MVKVDIKNSAIYFSGMVEGEAIGEVITAIISIDERNSVRLKQNSSSKIKPIRLYINSTGGYVVDMWSLISVMESCKTPIYTYCTGYAMSAGFMIFISGAKRFIGKHAKLMYHQPSGGCVGTAEEMLRNASDMYEERNKMMEYVKEKTNLTDEMLESFNITIQDVYFNAEKAIEYGCADEVC